MNCDKNSDIENVVFLSDFGSILRKWLKQPLFSTFFNASNSQVFYGTTIIRLDTVYTYDKAGMLQKTYEEVENNTVYKTTGHFYNRVA